MEKKFSLILDDEFMLYCKINNITDIEKLAKETFQKGFTILKYGEEPKGFLMSREKAREIAEIPKEKVKNTNLYDE